MINRLEIYSTWSGLVQAWKAVWQDGQDAERWRAFLPHCERLLAYAQSNGLVAVEASLKPLMDMLKGITQPGDAEKNQVDKLLTSVFAAVRDVCSEAMRRQPPASGAEPPSSMPATAPAPGGKGSGEEEGEPLPFVLILTHAPAAVSEVVQQMEHYGYRAQVLTHYASGPDEAERNQAVAVLVDLPDGMVDEAAGIVSELNRRNLKWFALTRRGDFPLRLQAVRAGAQGFFVAPLTIAMLTDAVDPIAYKTRDEPYRVLILDDSPTVLAMVSRALEPFENIHLRTLREPSQILDALLDFSPDVLLLDFHMVGCTGLEVAKIIRQNKSFESIPILYLTSETSEDVQLEAMRHGGDDFLTKPISLAQLVNAVMSKAERYRGLRKLMVEDSLTGLFNHVKTKALLQQALVMAERSGVPVSYAIIDIDHFKKVNDTYGHSVGDKVIKALARFLKQRVRKADVVGRYGGEEFVLVLFNSTARNAMERVEALRRSFATISHTHEGGVFSATFSAGIAHYPAYSSLMELMVAGDDALYASKRAGRNQVTLAERSRD